MCESVFVCVLKIEKEILLEDPRKERSRREKKAEMGTLGKGGDQ